MQEKPASNRSILWWYPCNASCLHTYRWSTFHEREKCSIMSRMVMSLNDCTAAKKTNQNNKVETKKHLLHITGQATGALCTLIYKVMASFTLSINDVWPFRRLLDCLSCFTLVITKHSVIERDHLPWIHWTKSRCWCIPVHLTLWLAAPRLEL